MQARMQVAADFLSNVPTPGRREPRDRQPTLDYSPQQDHHHNDRNMAILTHRAIPLRAPNWADAATPAQPNSLTPALVWTVGIWRISLTVPLTPPAPATRLAGSRLLSRPLGGDCTPAPMPPRGGSAGTSRPLAGVWAACIAIRASASGPMSHPKARQGNGHDDPRQASSPGPPGGRRP